MNMTSFDPKGGSKTPEEWKISAFKKTLNGYPQWKILGGFVLGGMTAAAINPIAGIAVAGWTVVNAIEGVKANSRNQLLIRDYGCIAHVLSDEEFHDYSQQLILEGNQDKLKAELRFALSRELDISDAAYDFLDSQSPTPNPQLPIPNSQSPTPNPQLLTPNSEIHQEDYTIDIVSKIASPVQNCIIFGIGGSGKGMLLANAIRRIKSVESNRTIFYIDPKAEEGEFGYTEGICDVIRRKKCKGKSSKEIVEWLDGEKGVLKEYRKWSESQTAPLLIIDEGTIAGSACKKEGNKTIGDLILHISSLGGASFEKIWLLAQSPFVTSLGIDLTSSSQVTSAAIITDSNVGVLGQWSKSSLIQKISLEELQNLFDNCPIPKTKRAIYWGGDGKWYAMPTLQNFSNIDRDNNKPAGDSLSTQQRQSLRSATTAVEISKSQKLLTQLERTTKSLKDFIISSNQNPETVLPIIIKLLKTEKRNDLLEKFNYGWIAIPDPLEALKFWAKTNDLTDDSLKLNWYLHTGKQLDNAGLQVLKDKLNGI
jgi:hypothetical protein